MAWVRNAARSEVKKLKGLSGKLIRVNLTDGSVRVEEYDDSIAKKYMGGKALAAYYAMREIKKGIDPLGPENKLYLFTGMLTGTPAPLGNRFTAATKSPLTHTFTDSYGGGFWGPELRFAGYDGIILEGASGSPVRIHIRDDDIQILDAGDLWGMDTWAATASIKNTYGETKKPVRVMSIGQAGERMDLLSAIIADARAAARGGVGAVMGSKKVKAISVLGSKRPQLYDQKGMMTMVKEMNARLNKNPTTSDALRYRGTNNILLGVNAVGALPYKDFQGDINPDAELISGEALQKELWNDGRNWHPCWNCTVKCTHYHVLEQPGFEGKIDDGPEYETVGLLGSNCAISDPKAISLADYLLDGYGLDTMSVGDTIAFLMDCYEKGLIDRTMTNGLDLRFGNKEAWMGAINAAGKGEGNLGRLVANGAFAAANEIGQDSMAFSPQVKGLELPAYDPRSGQGTA
ncbi:MAG TPA: aldehyde ferredoxin oxidoreductase N-terminal domain-containing protein, partial [Methanocellaceae archaeon]